MNKFAKLIERMEDLILAGVGIPLTPWTIINGDKLVPLLDRVRESLPEEIRQAQQIVTRRDEILEGAQKHAVQMVNEARERADQMLSESELLKAVQMEAERVRQQVLTEIEAVRKKAFEESESMKAMATEESRQIREEADRYAEIVLGTLDKSLAEFHTALREGHRRLRAARAEANAQTATSSRPQPDAASPTVGRRQQRAVEAEWIERTPTTV
jgi:Fe2+ transport system protein B